MSNPTVDRRERRERLAAKLLEMATDASKGGGGLWSLPVDCDVDPDSGSQRVSLEAALSWVLLKERIPEHGSRFYIDAATWIRLERAARQCAPRREDGTPFDAAVSVDDVVDDLLDEIIKHAVRIGSVRLASYLRAAVKEERASEPSDGTRAARIVHLGERWGALARVADLMDEAKVPPPGGTRGWCGHNVVLAFLRDSTFIEPHIERWAEQAERRAEFLRMNELTDMARQAVNDFNARTKKGGK